MKQSVIIVMIALFLTCAVVPAYANTRQENNKNIADFISDTVKLPLVLLGAFVRQGDHDQVKKEVGYKEHKGLNNALSGDTQFIGK